MEERLTRVILRIYNDFNFPCGWVLSYEDVGAIFGPR